MSKVSPILAEIPTGYNAYYQWQDWARLHFAVESGLASSYDRSGGNEDYSHYESPPGLITGDVNAVVKTIDGPGVIYRFWMPHIMAKNHYLVRMYFDGEPTPRIDTNSTTIMDGVFDYFSEPLISTCAGGQVCYEPIPFAQSLRIETRNKSGGFASRHYYQYSYLTFPKETAVDSYDGQLSAEQQLTRSAVISMFDNPGQHPDGNSLTALTVDIGQTSIPAGECLAIPLVGPGLVRKLNLKVNDLNDTELFGLRLKVYYESTAEPAIDASVANFFGAGNERAVYKSLPLGTDHNIGLYCYWPMPFRESIQINLCNTTNAPIDINSVMIEYEPNEIDDYMGYLCAQENCGTKQAGQDYYSILSVTGRGHYVGDLLYLDQDFASFAMLEGDDVITVDGIKTQYGTGLEDAYNGGAYYNWVVVQPDEPEGEYPQSATRPLNGILYVNKDETTARADQYRWRIADRIPFSRSIDVNVECKYAVNGSRWSSVAFWYQLPYLTEDINKDGIVNMPDFAVLAEFWMETGCGLCGGADFTNDQTVDANDLSKLVQCWLK